ncbi:MAG: hypothetical protein KA715_07650 [Xanthomonadaceae bacterium]|nr:hypothetical protein [Xanthomonadaceae bacterium]
MKVSYVLSMFLSMSLFLGVQAWSGGDHSGGGTAVVCRNADHTIRSAQLVDTYESLDALGLEFWEFKQPGTGMPRIEKTGDAVKDEALLDQEYNLILNQKFLDLPYNASLKILLMHNMKFVRNQINFSYTKAKEKFPGTYIVAPADLGGGRVVHIPYGCQPEFAAFYRSKKSGFNDTLEVNPDIWDAFSITDRVALIVHESIGPLRRMFYSDKTTELTRDHTARLVILAHDRTSVYSYWSMTVDMDDYRRIVPSREMNHNNTYVRLSMIEGRKAAVFFKLYDEKGNSIKNKNIKVKAGKSTGIFALSPRSEWSSMEIKVFGAKGNREDDRLEAKIQLEVLSQSGELMTQGILGTKSRVRMQSASVNDLNGDPVTKPFSSVKF